MVLSCVPRAAAHGHNVSDGKNSYCPANECGGLVEHDSTTAPLQFTGCVPANTAWLLGGLVAWLLGKLDLDLRHRKTWLDLDLRHRKTDSGLVRSRSTPQKDRRSRKATQGPACARSRKATQGPARLQGCSLTSASLTFVVWLQRAGHRYTVRVQRPPSLATPRAKTHSHHC